MPKDFKASQIRTSKIVISGSEQGKPALLIYSASSATDHAGSFESGMLGSVGSDVFLFVSGNDNSVLTGNRSNVTLFGGDVVVSGTFFAEKLVAEVDTTTNSDHHISGALYLAEKATDPDVDTDQVVLYAKDDAGTSKLYFRNGVGITEVGSGGGSVTSGSFNEVDNTNSVPTTFVTTSSLSLAGDQGISYGVDNVGSDVFLYVSGTRSGVGSLKDTSLIHSRSVFGGDIVVSGNLHAESRLVGHSDVVLNRTDALGYVLGGIGRISDTNSITFFNSQSANSGGSTKIQGYRASGGGGVFDYLSFQGDGANGFGGAKTSHFLPKDGGEDPSTLPFVTFLSGGAASSYDGPAGTDVGFFVSGSINSLGDSSRGAVVLGGDIAVSGSSKRGRETNVSGQYTHAEGSRTTASGFWSHSEGENTVASGQAAHAEGSNTVASNQGSHAEGIRATASGMYAHAEGVFTEATALVAHAEGQNTLASGQGSHAEGHFATASAAGGHAEGYATRVLGSYSHAEGWGTVVTSDYAHAEGYYATASGQGSHAQGYGTDAEGMFSFAGGGHSKAEAQGSTALGFNLVSSKSYGTVLGWFNERDVTDSLFTVGVGTITEKKDAFSIHSGSTGYTVRVGSNGALGTDTLFYVTGVAGSRGTTTRGTSVFAGDVVISGTLFDSAGNSIGSGGSISTVSGSTTVGTVTSIDFTEAGILNDNGSGVAALTGTIGNPEEGTYADGLFTTFTPQTTIGVAIDKINEVLKFLAPSPAPGLDNINADAAAGTRARLSFGDGSGLNPAGYSIVPATMPSGNTLSTVDINQRFNNDTTGSGGDLRIGVYNTLTTISGDLNSDVAASDYNGGAIVNHVANAFGDADQGSLTLEVNGSDIVTVDLTDSTVGSGVPGSGATSHFGTGDHSSSGFIQLSQTGSARTQSDSEFPIFQHRTGKFTVDSNSQRKGYNFVKVKHAIGSTTTVTNFVEWVFDEDGTDGAAPISANDPTIVVDPLLDGTNRYDLSGVRYSVTGSGEYRVRVENFYKHVYNVVSITNSISNSSILSTNPSVVPQIGVGEDHTKAFHVTSSFQTTASPHLGGIVTGDITVAHPTKTGLSNDGSVNSGRFLIYSGSNFSTNTVEYFEKEDYRVQSASFETQYDVVGGDNIWDSTAHMTASNGGHSDGLIFYNGVLTSPNTGSGLVNNGDFRSVSDGGSYFGDGYVYNNQPDYSNETGLRTFYRKIQNQSGSPVSNFKVQFKQGSGNVPTIVSQGTTLDSTKMKVFARLPGEPGSAWLDLGTAFTLGQTENRDGGRANNPGGGPNTGGNPINYFTFGTGSLANNDYFVMKIEADATLSREIGEIEFTVPGIDTSGYAAAPDLDAMNSTVAGSDANLSFGSTVPLAGYSNVGSAGGNLAKDINEEFPVSFNRYGVIDSNTAITGTLNHDVNQSGQNYPDDAFGNADGDTLSLIINGVTHNTANISNKALSGDVKVSDSGFINLSAAQNPTDDSGLVPDFTKWYRTGQFAIGPSDMRNGWNYAYVEHDDGTTVHQTNYIEWVRDADSSALNITNSEFSAFTEENAEGFYHQSGVKYFQDPIGFFKSQVNHAYSNVYSPDSDAITISNVENFNAVHFTQITGSSTVLGGAASHQSALPDLDTTLSEPTTGSLFVTGTIRFSRSTSIPGSSPLGGTAYSAAAKIDVKHPLDGTQTSGDIYVGTNSSKKFLVLSSSLAGNANTSEQFGREDYRIVSGNYTDQTDIATGKWDSSRDMNDSANTNYYSGLLVYNGKLVSPKDSRLVGSGDFRSHFDVGSSNLISPLSNVNYSSLPTVSSSHRHYYRHFENNTVNNVFNVDVTIRGDANIVGREGALSGSLGANDNVYVEGKIPGKTGWLDLGRATAGSGNITDGDGGLNGDIDQQVDLTGALNNLTFNGQTVNGTGTGSEKIVLKITAHKDWTGYISQIDISY